MEWVRSVSPVTWVGICTALGTNGTTGNAASYKVYVIFTTGNERGSNPVTITRPG